MRHNTLRVVSIICLAILMGSCNHKKSDNNIIDETKFTVKDSSIIKDVSAPIVSDSTNTGNLNINAINTKNYEGKAYFKYTDKTGATFYVKKSVEVDWPNSIPGFKTNGIQNAIMNGIFGKIFPNIDSAMESVKIYAPQPNATLISSIPSSAPAGNIMESDIEGSFHDMSYDIISYEIDTDWNAGGGKGKSTATYLNYDIKENKEITYNTVFKKEKTKDLIRLIEAQMQGETTNFDKIVTPSNFYIQKGNISFVFMPYEISATEGIISVISIPMSSLKHFFTPWAISRFKLK